jgi:hypothetical protein
MTFPTPRALAAAVAAALVLAAGCGDDTDRDDAADIPEAGGDNATSDDADAATVDPDATDVEDAEPDVEAAAEDADELVLQLDDMPEDWIVFDEVGTTPCVDWAPAARVAYIQGDMSHRGAGHEVLLEDSFDAAEAALQSCADPDDMFPTEVTPLDGPVGGDRSAAFREVTFNAADRPVGTVDMFLYQVGPVTGLVSVFTRDGEPDLLQTYADMAVARAEAD